MTGCVDDNYDLDNIDKTTELKVNDLVVPVNIDAIELSEIIKIDEGSKIKIVNINGQDIYAVSETGTFSSDPIEIDGFTAPAPTIEEARAAFEIVPARTKSISTTTNYTLGSFTPQKVEIKANDIDESIKEINSIDCEPMTITMTLTTSGFGGRDTMIKFNNVKLKFLKGLTLAQTPANYKYNPDTGILDVSGLECPGNVATIKLDVIKIDFDKAGTKLNGHDFNYATTVTLDQADLQLTMTFDDNEPPKPTEIIFAVTTTCTDMVATNFTGVVEYKLEGESLNIDPVSLDDIPDFLSNDKTNLRLANPQIYLSMNNPMASYGLGYSTGLSLTSVRPGDVKENFSLNPGELVNVGTNYGDAGPYNFVLSPSMPAHPLDNFAQNITHVGYSALSNVLAGNGIPQQIEIDLVNPELPRQKVSDFKLGNTIPGITGSYEFFAPLAFKSAEQGDNSSLIVYSGTVDGWSSDDLTKLTITRLQVDADAFSNLPVGADVSIYPIDTEGNKIPNVTVTPAKLSPNADGVPVTCVVEGEIKNLDGIVYEAVVTPGTDQPISPTQKIRLQNIRAKVTGFYITDFN
ncbi:MAG: hypothetical protein K2H18_03015 [Muribaculaceae bacterium]|nr:hypothetical protein [Muribaculaceae bacterium]